MARKLILVVEDDADIRTAFAEIITDEGYGVTLSENGQVALDFLNSTTQLPDLILLDILMPVKDGITFRKEQLETQRISHIPVIMLSASHKLSDLSQQMKVELYLKKPINIDELMDAIKKVLL